MKDLEQEVDNYIANVRHFPDDERDIVLEIARHFAEWQKERMEKEAKIADMRSPFTGGIVTIEEEERTLMFRGQEFTIPCKYYKCHDTGQTFYDGKQEQDMMWTLFRAYWERKGVEYMSDIDHYEEENE